MIFERVKQVTKRGLPSALFEIMLIFIGISLALAFDNWNTERNARALEKEYLQSIYTNLENNFKQIDDNMTFNANGYLKSAWNVSNFVKGEAFNEATLLTDFQSSGSYKTLSLETSGYTSIRSYGLHILKSPQLRVAIVELHDRHFDRLLNVWEGLVVRKAATELFAPIRMEYGDFTREFNSANEWREYLQDKRPLRNMYVRVINNFGNAINNTVPYLRKIHVVMEQLEQALKIKSNQQERLKRIEFWEWEAANDWPISDPMQQIPKDEQTH
ncbi:DUF6090 family protein [Aliiglaciecola litoralis]|uniref:Uncharacterized protein n=1 Tax=Aliiglaciecola litoralis TaxID=582857 RepID=A0ABP3WQZ2_9ALTE